MNGVLLTIRYSSPMPDVIKVQIIRHKGRKPAGPHFELYGIGADVAIEESEAAVSLTSGKLAVQIAKTGGWKAEFCHDGRKLTASGYKSAAHIEEKATGRTFVREQLDLGVGEYVYGLGERFTPFVKNGQIIDIWNEDGGTSSEQAYKNVPFYLSSKGYGVFVNHPELVSFEIGSEVVSKVQFSVEGEALE